MILLTTLNLTDSSITFSIHGALYEYFLSAETLRKVEFISRRSSAKALNLAKRHALHTHKGGSNAEVPAIPA